MSDLPKRLRDYETAGYGDYETGCWGEHPPICDEAADEIERLTTVLSKAVEEQKRLREGWDKATDYAIALQRCVEAHSHRYPIPEHSLAECPHHVEMLRECDAYAGLSADLLREVKATADEDDNCRGCLGEVLYGAICDALTGAPGGGAAPSQAQRGIELPDENSGSTPRPVSNSIEFWRRGDYYKLTPTGQLVHATAEDHDGYISLTPRCVAGELSNDQRDAGKRDAGDGFPSGAASLPTAEVGRTLATEGHRSSQEPGSRPTTSTASAEYSASETGPVPVAGPTDYARGFDAGLETAAGIIRSPLLCKSTTLNELAKEILAMKGATVGATPKKES